MHSSVSETSQHQTQKPSRNLAIDRVRGSLVILMVIGDYLSGINWVPEFLKHAPDIGFTVADAVAPAFVFVIGLNFGPSFARRFAQDSSAAYRYFLTRYLALLGVGAIISAGADVVGSEGGWGVLQALGIAGLLTLAVIRTPTWARFLIGLALLSGYQYFLDVAMLETVLNTTHGGLFGAISWAALLILATAVADIWRQGRVPFAICIAVLTAAAAVSLLVVPISKHRVSLSFVLVTLALSALVFLLVELAGRTVRDRQGLLSWWGQHALALYLIHLLVLSLFVTPPVDWWYLNVPLWLAVIELTAILGLMSAFAYWLHRRRTDDHS